ncbi:bifunctional glutamine synthetase adenylyltransferase/deadenyltransferase, partial [Klebsiella pneumoniae]|nr:bifunctional glutamine synthetase adenylyltransferase/deadenyltransferase [Klebsiella pneumoniae]
MMPLSSQLQQHWQTVADRLPADFPVAELSPQARSVMAFSDFVEQSVIAQPGWLNELADSSPEAEEWRHYETWLQDRLQAVADEAGLMRELRLFRRQMMVRIAWAQALSLVSEEETLQQLSVLAETLIVAARDWLYAACCKEWGTP